MAIDRAQAPVGAVVLAAGQSRRMGSPKMILPWGKGTVIGQVVGVLSGCALAPIVVVTGGAEEAVRQALAGRDVQLAHNARYATTEMLDSLRIGLAALPAETAAILVVLGDQPQIQGEVVTAVVERYRAGRCPIVAPSFQMRRGHPWLLERHLWAEIRDLGPEKTLRDFLSAHASEVDYLVVDTPSILGDLDTPQDYQRARPDAP